MRLIETRGVLVTSNTFREMSVKRAGTWRDPDGIHLELTASL